MINNNFNFDHSKLSMIELHKEGVRNARWLEEVFFEEHSKFMDFSDPKDKSPLFMIMGFTKETIPLLYIFKLEEGVVVSLHARKAFISEVKTIFCPS